MKQILAVALAAVALFVPRAFGADANELTARQSITINAPPEAVWAVVGDFNGLPRWLGTIEYSEILVGHNNEVGAIRQVTRRNGTKVTERLIDYDPRGMRLAYTYVDGAVAASDYFPVLVVKDGGKGTSVVEWAARFKRLAYWVDPPPAGQDDKTLTDFYNGLYKAGLESLKRVVEGAQ
jgi:mxaD protein